MNVQREHRAGGGPRGRGGVMFAAVLAAAVSGGASAVDTAPAVLVETAIAEQRVFDDAVTAYGVLEADPEHVIAVSIPRAGLVSQVWVELGQRVVAGDRLLAITTAPDAYLQYQQARSNLDFARRDAAREAQLLAQQLSTRARNEAAAKALRDAEAALAALRANGMDAQTQTLRAPGDGVVVRVDVQQGQRVTADSTTVLLANQQQLIARLGIEPEDLSRLETGAEVKVSGIFDPALAFTSQVRMIHASIDPVTRLVDVLVPVPAGVPFQPVLGSAVTARIHLADSTGIAVPRNAVLRDSEGAYLFTLVNGQAQRLAVTVGLSADDWLEVRGAVTAGMKVIVRGNYGLADGMAVRLATP